MYIPIICASGYDLSSVLDIRIPPVGVIAPVLLNFSLVELDSEFSKMFPGIFYKRYNHELYIITHQVIDYYGHETFFSEEKFQSLLDQLDLDADILSVERGKTPITSYYLL